MADASFADDPLGLFELWFAAARASEPNDPEAMAVATADAAGRPSVRMVLLKGHDARGFVFYTNEQSRKGDELAANPSASLLFHWKSLRRQVRIEGAVERVRPKIMTVTAIMAGLLPILWGNGAGASVMPNSARRLS